MHLFQLVLLSRHLILKMRLTFSYSKASNYDIAKFVRLIIVNTVICFPLPIIKLFFVKIIM